MDPINKRKNYYLVVDVETASSMANPLSYDIGFAVMDKQGNIYESYSYIVQEIFFDERNIFNNPTLMNSAYYAKKLPQYYQGLYSPKKLWVCKSIKYIRKVVANVIEKYDIKAICAYNATFDDRSLRHTIRFITKSETAEFFPTDVPILDIWTLACENICMKVGYQKFCYENGLYSNAKNVKTSAESVYAFLSDDCSFEEEHTGLADVLIECQILKSVFDTHNKLNLNIENMPWKIPQTKWRETCAKYYNEIF